MRKTIILASVLVVAGCAQNPPYGSPGGYTPSSAARQTTSVPVKEQAPRIVKVEDDQFSKLIKFVGISEEIKGENALFDSYTFLLRSWISRDDSAVSHQLVVGNVYTSSGWRYWNRGNDQSANTLEYTNINKDVVSCRGRGGCVYSEEFGLKLDDAALRNAASRGMNIKIYSKSGDDRIIWITPEQITKQFAAIDQKLGRAPQAMFQTPKPEPRIIPPGAPEQVFQTPRNPAPAYQPPVQNNAPVYSGPTDEADNSLDNQNTQSYPSGVFPPAQYPQAQQAPRQLTPQAGGNIAYPAPVRTY